MSAENGPGAVTSSTPAIVDNGNPRSITRSAAAHKWARFLRALLSGPHTTRQLERDPVFDHCPHSTASDMRKRGVDIETEMVSIVGYADLPARVARYSLTDAGREAAHRLLAGQ